MKKPVATKTARPQLAPRPEDIRNYAFHLYEQSGRHDGHELADWLEAEACLRAHIPVHHSRVRLHQAVRGLGPVARAELGAVSAGPDSCR